MEESDLDFINKIDPIYAKGIINKLINWPTSPRNLRTNCSIFEHLSPKESDLVQGLDENSEYYKLSCVSAYVKQALLQRGLMNMTYYRYLNEAFIESRAATMDGGRGKKQKGGMRLSEIFGKLSTTFLLLGVSSGIDDDSRALLDTTGDRTGLEMRTSAPFGRATSEEGLLKERMSAASETLSKVMEDSPWLVDGKEIAIAKDVNLEQVDFFIGKMEELNSRLNFASRDATQMCGEIATDLAQRGVFSSEAFYNKVLALEAELESKSKTKRTADSVATSVGYVTSGIGAVAYRTGAALVGSVPKEAEVDKKALMGQAYDIVSMQSDIARVGQVEKFSYSQRYADLCRATPDPRFSVTTTEAGGRYNIFMKTKFGNNDTGLLLLCHMETIERINIKQSLIDSSASKAEYDALQSLKERTEMEIELIKTSSLFAPLDNLMPGRFAVGGVVAESEAAVKQFEKYVDKTAEELPITEMQAKEDSKIRRKMMELKRAQGKQTMEEWQALASDTGEAVAAAARGTGSVLTTAVEIGVDVTTNVVASASSGLQNVTGEVADTLGTAVHGASGVLGSAAEGVGSVLKKTALGVSSTIFALLPAAIAVLGVAGAGVWIWIQFQRSFLPSFGSRTALPAIAPAPVPAQVPAPAIAPAPAPAAAPTGLNALVEAAAAAGPAGGKVTRKSKNKKGTKRSKRKVKRSRKNKKQKGGKRSRKNRNKK
jgi:hypothetical protein